MTPRILARTLYRAALFTAATGLAAQTMADPFPLPTAAPDTTANEDTFPFILADGFVANKIVDRNTLNALGLPSTFGVWDMIAFAHPENSAGAPGASANQHIFVPAEVGSGAGVFRFDVATNTFANLMVGNNTGTRQSNPAAFDPLNDDYIRFDPATYTPFNTVITGEETTGGRLFEITNPFAPDPSGAGVRWLSNVPAVAHEGLRFDADGILYFIDEDNSGSIYKYVPKTDGDLSVGQTFVLSVDAFAANAATDASQNFNGAANVGSTRTGAATWVAVTDADGNALTVTDPFAFVSTTGGRSAADELKGTPYGRPEDIIIKTLANGNEAVFFTATSENTVYTIELTGDTTAVVGKFVNAATTINLATMAAVGSAGANGLGSPDNLAIDAFGNVFIIEDQNPGDIWKAIDMDNDGVAEAIGRFLSLGVAGSEPTGMIFDPLNPNRALVVVQHPNSDNDAIWEIVPANQAIPAPAALPAGLALLGLIGLKRKRRD